MPIEPRYLLVGLFILVCIGVAVWAARESRAIGQMSGRRAEPPALGSAVCADCRHRAQWAHIMSGHVCDHPTRYREWRDPVTGDIKTNDWERECRYFNSRGQCQLFEPRPEGVPWPTRMPRPEPPPPPEPDRRISHIVRGGSG